MADYNIDDILAEYAKGDEPAKAKKSSDTAPLSVEDILKETGRGPDIFSQEKVKKSAEEARRRLEQERAEQEARRKAQEAEQARQEKLAEQRRKTEEERRRKAQQAQEAQERRRRAEEERRERLAAEEAKREERRKALEEAEKARREKMEEQRRQAETKRAKEEALENERKRLEQEADRQKEREAARIAELNEEERRKAQDEANAKRREEEESERKFSTKNIVFQEAPIELPKIEEPAEQKPAEPTPEELELEKALREQKVQSNAQKLLERESEMEDPDDFLAAINPYDEEQPISITQLIETIPSQQLAGDTLGVAGGDLKKLARENAAANDLSVTAIIGGETMVVPGTAFKEESSIDLEKTFVVKDDLPVFGEKKTAEIGSPTKQDMLLVNINRTIERKRLEDIKAESAASVTAEMEGRRAPSDGAFDPMLTVMPKTGEIPLMNPVVSEQKMKSLSSKRKRKISDFVLEDISDDDYDDDEYMEEEAAEDEDEEQIRADLYETHRSLRARFVLLLILTLAVCGVSVALDLGANLTFNLFGTDITFLDKRYDPDGFIYFNLVCGVLGVGLCAAAIRGGIVKLFKGKGDCDSVCAVSSAISLLNGVLQLMNTDYLQRSIAFLFVPAAMLGLLFNTWGKLSMIARARKNFRFISSDKGRYYAEIVKDETAAGAFTKGIVSELPVPAVMRKTEYLSDFLRGSYCEDKADRTSRVLTVLSLLVGLVTGLLIYLVPNSEEGMQNNVYWAATVANALICVFSPLSIMFIVNNPLRRATKSLLKSGSTLLGYSAAEEFSRVNSVLTDISAIFPASSVECTNLKPCRLQNSINNISLDQAIILAASLSINTGSILSRLFFEMIGGNEALLENIEGCVCEDNMGVLGWYGNKRLIMGNREHMKHHSIKVPELSAIAKYCRNGSDPVYLAVGGELAIIFFIRLTANAQIRDSLRLLTSKGVSVAIKSTDSIITVAKIADLFDIDPEMIKMIPSNLHEQFDERTKYTSSGRGAFSLNGGFPGFSRGICAAKKLMRDISLSQTVMLAGVFLAAVFMVILAFSAKTLVFSTTVIMAYQLFWLLPVALVQIFRRY